MKLVNSHLRIKSFVYTFEVGGGFLDVEAELDYVAVLYFIIFTFNS